MTCRVEDIQSIADVDDAEPNSKSNQIVIPEPPYTSWTTEPELITWSGD